jgi:transposase
MSTDAAFLPNDPERLRALLLAERQQHAATLAQIEATLSAQQRTIQQQEQTIAQLLRKYYGPQQERIDPDQLTLFDTEELEALTEELASSKTEPAAPRSSKNGHGRRRLPRNLPHVQVLHELPEAERACPCCGEVRGEIGRETSEQLEYIPGTLKVIEHVRVKYACRACQEQVTIAPKPPQPIDKGLPGPGLLAHTVLSKYGDHLPLYVSVPPTAGCVV